jgi:putative iron-regulated protein
MSPSKLARMRSHGSLAALALGLFACGGGSSDAKSDAAAAVVRQYAVLLDAEYKDSIKGLETLKAKVDALVAAPSASGLEAARQAWLDARAAYGQSEISRFYGGPLDVAQATMNEWPIDENYVDYTAGNPDAGLINDTTQFPEITPELLMSLAGRGGTENYATGFHAVEFILWGQRLDQNEGPGNRPYTDFVDGGTAAHQARRRTYLQVTTLILLEQMRAVEAEWNLDDEKSYGAKFVAADSHQSLTKIFRGFSQAAISEVLYERLSNPFRSHDRKDEQSCFSESTLSDIKANILGVENLYLGQYGKLKGPSLSDLMQAKDPDLDKKMRARLRQVREAIAAIPPPLDHAILSDPSSDPYLKVKAAIDTFTPLLGLLHDGAARLDITNNL